jgi:hypothetical protein
MTVGDRNKLGLEVLGLNLSGVLMLKFTSSLGFMGFET